MPTEAQMEANRRNARLSTGPRTAEGKAVVRRNAFQHGLRAVAATVREQQPGLFDSIYQPLCQELQPETGLETIYVERMALCQYKLIQLDERTFTGYGKDPDNEARVFRMQRALERAFDRALASLRQLRKERKATQAQPDPEPEPEPISEPQPQPASIDPTLPFCPTAGPSPTPAT